MNGAVNQKTVFVGCALLAILLLVYACLFVLGLVATTSLRLGTAIAGYTLVLDFVVGIFTVWGLFWAATQFVESTKRPAVRVRFANPMNVPFLNLSGILSYPLEGRPPNQATGWMKIRVLSGPPRNIPNIACGMYLENKASREGRHIVAVLEVDATPRPTACLFHHRGFAVRKNRVHGEIDPEGVSHSLSIQFAEQLVVYQSPVLVGELFIRWNEDLTRDELPDYVAVEYDIYTLDGAHHEKLELLITEWRH
ncbi:MAG: hypothetical protein ACOC6F_01490 [bacterium]